jgi:hypothetical protein
MERYSSTDDSVVETEAAVVVEAAATGAVEVTHPIPLYRLGRGNLKTLPPVVRPTTTGVVVASEAAGEEGVAEAWGGDKFQRQTFLAIQESLISERFLPLFPEEQHYPTVSEWAWRRRRDRRQQCTMSDAGVWWRQTLKAAVEAEMATAGVVHATLQFGTKTHKK